MLRRQLPQQGSQVSALRVAAVALEVDSLAANTDRLERTIAGLLGGVAEASAT